MNKKLMRIYQKNHFSLEINKIIINNPSLFLKKIHFYLYRFILTKIFGFSKFLYNLNRIKRDIS